MKKIGFIDYYLDEWHANHYPSFIKELSQGGYNVTCAYGAVDSPNGLSNAEWSEMHGIPLKSSIEDVMAECDAAIVLSPDNPEQHPFLCDIPFRSGKPVYVDKTFAVNADTARTLFEIAEKHNTPCFSSSALRFSSELTSFTDIDITCLYSEGPGLYDIYSIHQIEPIVSLMKATPTGVMFNGSKAHPSMIISFADGRYAHMIQRNDPESSFRLTAVRDDNSASVCTIRSDYMRLFIRAMLSFFDNGKIPVPHTQTIDILAIRDAGFRAMNHPFTWESVR